MQEPSRFGVGTFHTIFKVEKLEMRWVPSALGVNPETCQGNGFPCNEAVNSIATHLVPTARGTNTDLSKEV